MVSARSQTTRTRVLEKVGSSSSVYAGNEIATASAFSHLNLFFFHCGIPCGVCVSGVACAWRARNKFGGTGFASQRARGGNLRVKLGHVVPKPRAVDRQLVHLRHGRRQQPGRPLSACVGPRASRAGGSLECAGLPIVLSRLILLRFLNLRSRAVHVGTNERPAHFGRVHGIVHERTRHQPGNGRNPRDRCGRV